jgi:hypothetical protein
METTYLPRELSVFSEILEKAMKRGNHSATSASRVTELTDHEDLRDSGTMPRRITFGLTEMTLHRLQFCTLPAHTRQRNFDAVGIILPCVEV